MNNLVMDESRVKTVAWTGIGAFCFGTLGGIASARSSGRPIVRWALTYGSMVSAATTIFLGSFTYDG
jgi:hypothetical protein